MKKISLPLSISIAISTTILGIAIGYYLTPEYRQFMYDDGKMDLGRADRTLDLRYINQMAAHHRGAMLLAEQAKAQSNRKEVQDLADAILSGEPKLIDELYSWKKDWYGDSRKAQDPIVANLGSSGETFDLRFLNAMIAHHEAGIMMTKDARIKSSRAEVLDNADAVESFLSQSSDMLKSWRKDWYNI